MVGKLYDILSVEEKAMNIYWECDDEYNILCDFYDSVKGNFESILSEFNVTHLEDIYVTNDSAKDFSEKCSTLFNAYYGRSHENNFDETIMAECLERDYPQYKQTLIIKKSIFFPFLVMINDEAIFNDKKAKLTIKKLMYHELSHLYEMYVRWERGLMRNWKINNSYENSKILWSEYYAERRSAEMFSEPQQNLLDLNKKFSDFQSYADSNFRFGPFIYNLTHFLAINGKCSEIEIQQLVSAKGCAFLASSIAEMNKALKSLYNRFPDISNGDIINIQSIYENMINETRKALE